jgi:hypothetical protein
VIVRRRSGGRPVGAASIPTCLALLAVSLLASGCETTAEKSAKLERAAKRVAVASQKGLSVTRESTIVKVVRASIVRGKEGSAATVTLHNLSAMAQRDVPVAISLNDAHGAHVYRNDTPGLASTLTSIALLPAHTQVTWIDDQVTSSTATSIRVKIGDGSPARAPATAQVTVAGEHVTEDPSGGFDAEGTVRNGSRLDQDELVIYAVAQRAGKIVAAGRALLTSLPAGSSSPFQIFFIGDPRGARLQISAPPTTPG